MEELSEFCSRNGYEEFAEYARESSIQTVLMELTEAILKERPDNPRKFLVEKLEEEIPVKSEIEKETVPIHQMIRLFEATRNIAAEIVPSDTIDVIIRETIRLLNCDRVSVFAYDKRTGMLILTASNLTKPIRVNPGQGIAGYVFTTKQQVNIPDCYKDSRFDSNFDLMTGYTTRSMIVMPIVDHEDNALGVLQAINKLDGGARSRRTSGVVDDDTTDNKFIAFSETDIIILGHLTQLVGVALRNAEVYREAIIASERSQGLLAMLSSLSQDLGAQSTILTVTMHAQQLVLADKCLCFIVDGRHDQLWSVARDTNKEIRVNKNKGLVGVCAMTKEVVNRESTKDDPIHDKSLDDLLGCEVENMLCVPILAKEKTIQPRADHLLEDDGEGPRKTLTIAPRTSAPEEDKNNILIAVITLVNKREFDDAMCAFDEEDISILEKFARFVADKLSDSQFIKDSILSTAQSEGDAVFGQQPRTTSVFRPQTKIEEESDSEQETPSPVVGRSSVGQTRMSQKY